MFAPKHFNSHLVQSLSLYTTSTAWTGLSAASELTITINSHWFQPMALRSHPRLRAFLKNTSLFILEYSPSMPPCLLHFGCFLDSWTHHLHWVLSVYTWVPQLMAAFPGETENGWENRKGFWDIPSFPQFYIMPFKGAIYWYWTCI